MSVRTSTRARPWRHRIGTALGGLLVAAGIAIVPASPAHAIQTIAWTTTPASTGTFGSTTSFAWSGTANTFLGARITGCFANFPDGNNYTRSFGGNFTTGNCNYVNRVLAVPGNYPITVGFTLSTGGTMSMQWNVAVAVPSPTVVMSPLSDLTATSAAGVPAPPVNAYGADAWYGTYGATCTPSAGTMLPVGTTTFTCSATNGGGMTGTAQQLIQVLKATPTMNWSVNGQYSSGVTYAQLQNATMSPGDAAGAITYFKADGTPTQANAAVPVGANQTITAVYTPTGQAANSFNQVTRSKTFTVVSSVQNVAFAAGTPTGKTFGDAPFNVTAVGTFGGGPVSITTQAGSTCHVSSSTGSTTVTATVTIVAAGGCVLLADQAATDLYTAAPTAVRSVSVAKQNTTTTWATPGPLTYGQTLAASLNAGVTPSVSGTITYEDADGTLLNGSTVLDAGVHNVTAIFTPADPANHVSSAKANTITVSKAAAGLNVPPVDDTTYGSGPVHLDATSNSPGTYTWESTTAQTCSVDQDGIVTTLSAGTCDIVVTQAATQNYLAATETTSFAVHKATPTLDWANPDAITYLTPLSATELDAAIDPSSVGTGGIPMGDIAYTLPNGDPADGVVLGAGNHTLTATFTPYTGWDESYEPATAQVTIEVWRYPASDHIVWDAPADITYGTALDETQLDATVDGVPGTFEYVVNGENADGVVLDAGSHTLIVMFTPEDPANYMGGTLAVPLNVNRAGQEITWDLDGTHTLGDDPFTVTATGGASGNPVTFATDSSACSVDGDTVTIVRAGDCTITASQDGNDNYWPAEPSTRSVSVAKAVPTITWDEPAAITYGDTLGDTQLDAAISEAGATGTMTYTLANGTAAAGAELDAGDDQTLTATFTPDESASADYESVSATVTIDVAKADQTTDFAPLADATYGDGPLNLGPGGPVTYTASGSCSIVGHTVTIDGAGICAVTADKAGDANHNAAASVTRSFTIAKAAQTPALALVDDRTWGDPAFDVEVTPGASSSAALLAAEGACVAAGTTVFLTGAGTCALTVTQEGDANHLPADPVTRTFSIAKNRLTVTALNLIKVYGAATPGTGYRVDGLVGGDTESALTTLPTCTTTTVASTPVGTTDVTCSGAEAANYVIAYSEGAATTTKAPLTLVAPVVTRTAGTANPTLAPTFTGFVNGDNVSALTTSGTCATTATTSSPVGVYPVTCSGATAHDYNVTPVPGSVTVTPAVVVAAYQISAFGSPVVDGYSVKRGSTVPVKFALLTSSGATVPKALLQDIANGGRATVASRPTGSQVLTQQGAAKLTGSDFHFNLDTGNLALGSNQVIVTVKAADGSVMATRSFTIVTR